MKSLLLFGLLLTTLILAPGCSMMTVIADTYVEVVFQPPPPPPPVFGPTIIIEHPISKPHDPGHGRPVYLSDHKKVTRDSGVQRSGRRDSNPSIARNNDTNRRTRDSGIQRNRQRNLNPTLAITDNNIKPIRDPGSQRKER